MSTEQEMKKQDNLQNALSRKGVRGVSKSGSNDFVSRGRITDNELRTIFSDSGMGAATVSRVVNDAYRKGFVVDDENLMEQFDALNGKEKFRQAQLWGRLFGGSILVMLINDGAESLEEPLNPNRVKSIDGLQIYDRTRLSIMERYADPLDPKYEEAKVYQVASFSSSFNVHESRVIRFDGVDTDYETKMQQNNGWDHSAMQPVYEALIQLMSVMGSGEQIMDEFIIGILKMKNLMDLSRDKDSIEIVHRRLDIVDESKSNENTVVIDSDEEYSKHISSISGFNELLEGCYSTVSGSCQPMMPQTILFGRSPGGQNSTGDSDIRLWYDAVASYQDNSVTPKLREFFDIIADGKEYTIEHNSVYEATDLENAEEYDKRMSGNEKAVRNGIYSPEEVALHDQDVELLWERDTSEPEDDAEE
jgi:phage-related protein (TIGR01555 family)